MKIALGCDHGGFEHKNAIKDHLEERGFEVKDFGIYENVSVDYPDIAVKVGNSVAGGECELGILVCGTGIGMSLAANKIKGIRAAACSEHFSAKYTRMHNNSNILCLGGRVIGVGT
ncbi:MAG: ribose 5-phosphate isomerase B, partial [Clostridia bacterium]|nr:ribose 5-phosphate isomerase B [Clostridia bacterium]